jgi:vancomycin resistance protein YoaR
MITAVGVLAVGAYLVGYLLTGDRLAKNAQISGVSVGGLDRSAAIAKLERELTGRATRPITVAIGNKKDRVVPSDAGLAVDVAESVDRAGARRSLDPRHIWRVLTGGSSIEAVVTADRAALNSTVAELAERHDVSPRGATLTYQGASSARPSATLKPAQDGTALRRDEAAEALKQAFLKDNSTVVLPVDRAPAAISDAEAQQVRKDFAVPAVSGPVEAKVGQAGQLSITPSMIAQSVTFEPKGGALVPEVDADKLFDAVGKPISQLDLDEPRDATVRLRDGRPVVVPAVNGTVVPAAALAEVVRPALTRSGGDRTVSVEPVPASADFSTEDARKLRIQTVTGKFTTRFPYADYRNVNIGRAAELINGTVLKPGETFSLNKIVGERTKANGFTEGNIISGGKFRLELGGGVSQSATTTFNAMFFAGLEDIEHRPHTLYINRYPAGREATVAWPSLDLKFRNNTKYGVLVQAERVRARPGTQGSITVKMWSTKTYDKVESSPLRRSNFTSGRDVTDSSPKCQPMSPVPGFDVNYSRLFYRDDKIIRTERFFWRYRPTDRVRCV